ncbi:hypothetical protein K3495_g7110 [Podosphaera aphanis]|nr:hypothetical protein K3495_g7110 [Podosphaera aphanis]
MRMTPEVRRWLAEFVATGVGREEFKKTYRPNQQQLMLIAESLLKSAPVEVSDVLRVSNQDFNKFSRKRLNLTAMLDPDCWKSLQKNVDLLQKEGRIATIQDVLED